MSLVKYSTSNRSVTLMLVFLTCLAGVSAYLNIGKLEDPEFTIKTAKVSTHYAGATPEEVENEVTDVLETAIQQMPQLWYVKSESSPGLSEIEVNIQITYKSDDLPQIWDELRRKVGDAQKKLPPGAGRSTVYDDFGDVYGFLFVITGDGYSMAEMEDYAKDLRQELMLVDQVAKVAIAGARREAIYVEVSRSRAAAMGISPQAVSNALMQENLVSPSGAARVSSEYVRIEPTGDLDSVEAIAELLVHDPFTGASFRLRDVADVRRDYVDPPSKVVRYDGQAGLEFGVSVVPGGNVVVMGESLRKRLNELESDRPVGIEMHTLSFQSDSVTDSVGGFLINFAEAVVIVVVILLLTMGPRSGLLIGAVLAITVAATLFVMQLTGFSLERISLGALIIALGMLVDNAIVVTEGVLMRAQQGMDKTKAAIETVGQAQLPLLGATLVAVLAFSAIGLSPDSTGEYCSSLFYVIMISLMLSWLTAITVTPLFCILFLKTDGEPVDPADAYKGAFYVTYARFLEFCLRRRYVATGVTLVLLMLSVLAFRGIPISFFPPASRAMFGVDVSFPEGTDIRSTQEQLAEIEQWLLEQEHVEGVATMVGAGATRFMLTYSPHAANPSYALLLVKTDSPDTIDPIFSRVEERITERLPDAVPKSWRFALGSATQNSIEARISGPDPKVLRQISAQVKDVLYADGGARNISDDWRQRVKVVRPTFSDTLARSVGLTRAQIKKGLETAYSGSQVGLYRENDKLIPIIARPPAAEREDLSQLGEVRVSSPLTGQSIRLDQVVTGFIPEWEDVRRHRRDKQRTLTVACEPKEGLPSATVARVKPLIDALELPEGYELVWGGELESSSRASASLAASLPASLIVMALIVVMLFGNLRDPLIIWLTVPLALIGVVIGFLVTGQSFGFVGILGVLSLIGMLIKNSIVLIDEINVQMGSGKAPYEAVVFSGVSRLRPVVMAAATTVLGMAPLLKDPFFVGLAVTIMFGLTFASVLTVIVVPVFYVLIYRVPSPAGGSK